RSYSSLGLFGFVGAIARRKERCSSPARGKEQLGLPAWHFTTLCIEAGFRACKEWPPELPAPVLTRNGRNRSMSAQPQLPSDIEGLAHQIDPLSRRCFFMSSAAA